MRSKIILSVFLVFLFSAFAQAGECIYSEEEFVEFLEEYAASGSSYDSWHCLDSNFDHSTNRWAGPIAESIFRAQRESPYRERVKKACTLILDNADYRNHWLSCLQILAMYGIRRAGRHDTLLELAALDTDGYYLPLSAARLGDRRATPMLIEMFKKPRPGVSPASKTGIERRITILNALWHLADPGSRDFLVDTIKNDPSPLVRKRAERALRRLPDSSL